MIKTMGRLAITHPRVLYRYSELQDQHDFDQLFGDVFSIVFCDCDEQALQALQQGKFDGVFVEYSCLGGNLASPLLAVSSGQGNPQKILLNADVSLDGVIQLLSSQSLNKCFARPYDANLIKSAVYAAQMKIQEPLRAAFSQANAQPSVLIVDDEVYASKYLKKNLEVLGASFDILCAANAQAALDLLEQHKTSVAVIVSDHKMPGMKGSQLLNKIRNIQPNIVRILTSAYGEVDVALDAMNEGSIFQYIKKPWDAEQVLGCINQALDRHRVLQQQSQQSQQALDAHYQQIIQQRRQALRSTLEPKLQAALGVGQGQGQEVLDQFIHCLDSITVSASYPSAIRASHTPAFEAQLLTSLCGAMQTKLDEMTGLLDSKISVQQDFIHAWLPNDAEHRPSLGNYCHREIEQALAILMNASGMQLTDWQLNVSPEAIRIALPLPLKIYSHVLGPVKKLSERFIQQQTALLMLFVMNCLLEGELSIEGGKQSLDLRFTCTLEGRA